MTTTKTTDYVLVDLPEPEHGNYGHGYLSRSHMRAATFYGATPSLALGVAADYLAEHDLDHYVAFVHYQVTEPEIDNPYMVTVILEESL